MRILLAAFLIVLAGCSAPADVSPSGSKEGKGGNKEKATEVTVAGTGNLRMRITLVTMDGTHILVNIKAENRSDTKLVEFPDAYSGRILDCQVTDEFGNRYTVSFETKLHPAALNPAAGPALHPGKTLSFHITASRPIDKATMLYLDISSLASESSERFKFQIPIKKKSVKINRIYDRTDNPPARPPFVLAYSGEDDMVTVLYSTPHFDSWLAKWNADNQGNKKAVDD